MNSRLHVLAFLPYHPLSAVNASKSKYFCSYNLELVGGRESMVMAQRASGKEIEM